jgi:flagellar basal body-associated protein FliL
VGYLLIIEEEEEEKERKPCERSKRFCVLLLLLLLLLLLGDALQFWLEKRKQNVPSPPYPGKYREACGA